MRPAEEDIKTVALCFCIASEETDYIMECMRYVRKNSTSHHRLVLYYLVNEILISNREIEASKNLKDGLGDFIEEFFLSDLSESRSSPKTFKRYESLKILWDGKKMFENKKKKEIPDSDELVSNIIMKKDNKEELVHYLGEILEKYRS